MSELAPQSLAVPAGQARLTLFRPGEGLAGAARSARIKLDGQPVGSCGVDGFLLLDAPPGPHVIEADLPDVPGSCRLNVQARAGQARYFKLATRSGSLADGLVLGVAGQAAESAGHRCSGAYQMVEVDSEAAKPMLRTLRSSQ